MPGSCKTDSIKTFLFTFGVITSIMHMTWMKYTCGRMKSDYNYSNSIVYNNFPWPEIPTETKRIEFLFEAYDKYTAGLFVGK